jgi:hypothetical protein
VSWLNEVPACGSGKRRDHGRCPLGLVGQELDRRKTETQKVLVVPNNRGAVTQEPARKNASSRRPSTTSSC